jgi:DNA-binding transcriptional LysR family regulator
LIGETDQMQLELIETYLDLMESRSFRLTADRLGITQSTVSGRIRSLELAVGSTLFTRGRSGAAPTAAGKRFEGHARAIKASWGLARQELGALDSHEGALRIACTVSLADSLLSEWMDKILADSPRLALHVEADYSPQMIDDLVFGNLDIGVLYAPRYVPEIEFELLKKQQFVLVSEVAKTVRDIPVSSYVRAAYTPAFEKAHSELLPLLSRPRLSAGLDTIVINRIKRAKGSAYVPHHALAELRMEGLLPVEDAPVIEQPIYMATHIRRRSDAIVRHAVKALQAVVAAGKYGI